MTAIPKPAYKKERAARKRAVVAIDEKESAKVRKRSEGRCEVRTWVMEMLEPRCRHLAAHVHHLIGGRGKRGIGDSALAENKVHCCVRCHTDIHAGKLKSLGGVRFRRD
jgi:hypothetical protein